MTRILLVRHGRAAASFTDDLDPGLDDLGRQQAEDVAQHLKAELPLAILSSPLRRARETAEPLRDCQGGEVSLEPRVSEIPSPGLGLDERGAWLQGVMTGTWPEQSPELVAWRNELIDCLVSQPVDCVIFSHFVAINVAVASAEGDERLTVFRPDNTSVTELSTDGHTLTLVRRGGESISKVN